LLTISVLSPNYEVRSGGTQIPQIPPHRGRVMTASRGTVCDSFNVCEKQITCDLLHTDIEIAYTDGFACLQLLTFIL